MKDPSALTLLGGRVCLDFVNTVDWRGREHPEEYLNTYQDIVAWSRHVGTITNREARTLLQKANSALSDAKNAHRRAIDLRETIYRIFAAAIEGAIPIENDMIDFNTNLCETMRFAQLIGTEDRFYWDTDGDKSKLDWILNPIIHSAADLLVSDSLNRVKRCSDSACGWLFLDVSRNQSRRWCNMKGCGNRAKASRFYHKSKRQKNNP